MRTPHFISGALAAAVLAAGCSRAEADRNAREVAAGAREAAADVKQVAGQVAGQAGERLADGWVTSKVQAKFFADRRIKARYVEVSTRDGVVTLKGYVDDLARRDEALAIARNTEGVQKVVDQLKIGVSPTRETFAVPAPTPGAVATGGGSADYDATVAANAARAAAMPVVDDQLVSTVQARFFLDPAIKTRHISVTANQGVVTLRGAVANENERAQALLIARHTNGVGRVEDVLSVDPGLR